MPSKSTSSSKRRASTSKTTSKSTSAGRSTPSSVRATRQRVALVPNVLRPSNSASPSARASRSVSKTSKLVALRQSPAPRSKSGVGAATPRKRGPVCVSDAAAMITQGEEDSDSAFEPESDSESDEEESFYSLDASVEELNDSPEEAYSPPSRKSHSSTSTRRASRSHGEPSSNGSDFICSAQAVRGKRCEAPMASLSAKKSLVKQPTSSKSNSLRVAKQSQSGSPCEALGDTSSFMETSLQNAVVSSLPGMEKYISYRPSDAALTAISESNTRHLAVQRVCDDLPEREALIQRLATFIGPDGAVPPPCLYIVGHTACAKTTVVKRVLQALDVYHIWVDGTECYAQDVLFALVMSRLTQGSAPSSHTDSNDSFVRQLDNQLGSSGHKRMILVVDNVHRFLRFPSPGPIPLLQRLSSLITSCSVGVVLISALPWEDLWPCLHSTVPLQLRFPNYSQAELVSILRRDCPVAEQASAYGTFVELFCSCSKLSCINLRQLRHLIHILYPIYYQPVLTGDVDARDKHELWRQLVPVQRRIVNNFFQHSSRTETMAEEGSRRQSAALDLPHFAKFLVIAGFLASHNPATLDTHLFTKLGDRMSKRARHAAKKPGKKDVDYQREGPKVFPMHRLMAIFFSILEQPVPPSAHIFSQVASLVSLRIFSQENEASRAMDDPHYMCLASEDVALELARSVDFDLGAVQSGA